MIVSMRDAIQLSYQSVCLVLVDTENTGNNTRSLMNHPDGVTTIFGIIMCAITKVYFAQYYLTHKYTRASTHSCVRAR